jgi:pantothenate kinase
LAGNEQQVLSLTPEDALAFLVRQAHALPTDRRTVIGITGGPGTGKSTIATELVAALGPVAAYVPMDGFHMLHAKLEALGMVADKGAPHTFEGEAFAAFISSLKTASGPVSGPGYSRAVEDVVQNAFIIAAESRILVAEGNYLLLTDPPWGTVRPQLDLSVFIDVPREKVRARLVKRHAEHGLFSEERNRQHIERVDLANYDLVQRSRPRADIVIDLLTDA